ncbi:hypothetical protein PWT90_04081 [Aphanocladium album]|nr:hypothetical protein PWT90_04081 [Aphanocladium album]
MELPPPVFWLVAGRTLGHRELADAANDTPLLPSVPTEGSTHSRRRLLTPPTTATRRKHPLWGLERFPYIRLLPVDIAPCTPPGEVIEFSFLLPVLRTPLFPSVFFIIKRTPSHTPCKTP